ncbi:MAG: Methionyl-tRNA formyltransferase (EC [uncultured Thiotrichaceae bacterium]|uniref:Methionyl-tRNA formyltransferase n=1 Tax=uncultured Thiotrichaceae bacterium TaxID=298394 RepID=A0A6S6U7G8_9GAMM|nr:MAG: Methionyl-tRNA formyltransferase (EC [uncultured Thiotrichaceae bacterium]
MTEILRIIYAGTPDFAVPALQALIDSKHQVVAVYTQPDRPAGRGRKVTFGPVKQLAVNAEIPVEQPESLKTDEALQQLVTYDADVMIVAAYGLILPKAVLETPKYGCLNIHGSLLPKWRGAAPIHRAIQMGDEETGITIMQMDVGLDTGDMLLKSRLPITEKDTGESIHDALADQGAKDLLSVLVQLQAGALNPEKQDETLATYAHKLSKAEAEIDWEQSAKHIDNTVRAFNPWPAAYTLYHGKPMKIHMSAYAIESSDRDPGTVIDESKTGISVATGDGVLIIKRLQMPGKKAMDVQDFLNGHSLSSVVLGQ